MSSIEPPTSASTTAAAIHGSPWPVTADGDEHGHHQSRAAGDRDRSVVDLQRSRTVDQTEPDPDRAQDRREDRRQREGDHEGHVITHTLLATSLCTAVRPAERKPSRS